MARSKAFRQALGAVLLSRLVVWAAAILSAVILGVKDQANAAYNDLPQLTAAVPSAGHVLLTPLARWDAVWVLGIVQHGYAPVAGGQARAAFFPLYPLTVWLISGLAASAAVSLVAAFAVSLAAFAGALYLLHRLVTLELGPDRALPTLLLLALFPGSLFFGIPYSESLFLLVTVGAFYAARTGHWAWAGICLSAASAARSSGVLLVAPLAVMYLYGPREPQPATTDRRGSGPRSGLERIRPRHPLRADAAWLVLAPLGLAAYSGYLGLRNGDALAWLHVQALWSRHFAGPFGGIVDGAGAAWRALHGLLTGTAARIYLQHGQIEPTRAAIADVLLFLFALAALAALIGTFRRLPAAYGIWALLGLLLPLSYPAQGQPLESLPRFTAVLFPLFMWLSTRCRWRGALEMTLGIFAALLGLFAAQYAAWEFVS